MKLFWTPAPALLRWSFRRAIGPVFLLVFATLAAVLWLRDWAPPTARLGVDNAFESSWIVHGLARQGIWSGVCLVIVPMLVLRAARTVGAWRVGEVDWLASSAAARSTILVWTWLGLVSAALLVLFATGLLAEMRVGRSTASLRLAGEIRAIGEPGSAWVQGRVPLVWRAADPSDRPEPREHTEPRDRNAARDQGESRERAESSARGLDGSRARFELALGSSAGPGAHVILSARRVSLASSGGAASRTEKRVGTRSEIEVEIPAGSGELEFALECAEDGDRVLLMSKSGELWTPVASDRAASAAILARTSIALVAWLALALGLGAWMHATSAAALLLALMLPAWLALEPSTIWPGGDLFEALAIVGRGRVPPAVDLRSVLAAAFMAAIGLGLARWSLARWRRES